MRADPPFWRWFCFSVRALSAIPMDRSVRPGSTWAGASRPGERCDLDHRPAEAARVIMNPQVLDGIRACFAGSALEATK